MKLGLREANQQFSKAIKAVRAGKEVVLTGRGRPIAVIRPIKEADSQLAALQRMVDEGLITLPLRKGPMPAPLWKPVKAKGKALSQTIIEDRESAPDVWAYFDTSALVRRYVDESGRREVLRLLRPYEVVTSAVVTVELPSAFHRRVADGTLNEEPVSEILKRVAADRDFWLCSTSVKRPGGCGDPRCGTAARHAGRHSRGLGTAVRRPHIRTEPRLCYG